LTWDNEIEANRRSKPLELQTNTKLFDRRGSGALVPYRSILGNIDVGFQADGNLTAAPGLPPRQKNDGELLAK